MLNLYIATCIWKRRWSRLTIQLYCDNAAAVSVLQTGRGRDKFLLACARAIWLNIAEFDIKLLVQHKPGIDRETADALSILYLKPEFKDKVLMLINDTSYKRMHVCPQYFELSQII